MSPRNAAHTALRVFRNGGDFRKEAIEAADKLSNERDRSLAMQITLGVVRNAMLCDYYISSASNIKLGKIEPVALDILRAAVYQIAFLDKIPARAAVNEAVKAARRKLNPRAAGFINAVLRKLSSKPLPEVKANSEEERLSILYSHPLWLTKEFVNRIGIDNTKKLLEHNNSEPPIYARVNTLKITEDGLLENLRSQGIKAAKSSLDNTLELRGTGDITRLKSFKKGEFYVQDPASTRGALTMSPKRGEKIIDGCAAPGGKSFTMAISMENEGEILAFDSDKKIHLIDEGAKRLGITIINSKGQDSAVFDESLKEYADGVLTDVPCSGFGVIRKKPEIRYKSEEEIRDLPQIAYEILENCSKYVKSGGRLVYSTCTLLKRENEDVVEKFLNENPHFRLEEMKTYWPHEWESDGFFTALLWRK